MAVCQGRGRWGLGTGSAPVDGGHGAALQGSGHRPELPELRECWYTTLRHWVWVLSGCVVTGVGLSDPYGSLPTLVILQFSDPTVLHH